MTTLLDPVEPGLNVKTHVKKRWNLHVEQLHVSTFNAQPQPQLDTPRATTQDLYSYIHFKVDKVTQDLRDYQVHNRLADNANHRVQKSLYLMFGRSDFPLS